MDGFTGLQTATAEQLPDAVAVMDLFHVVRLVGDAVDRCRRRVQQRLHGHRGRAGDPLYASRRTLHTGDTLLTDTAARPAGRPCSTDEQHVEVEATWAVYQRMVAAYRDPDRRRGRQQLVDRITSLRSGVPAGLSELRTLRRTLARSADDVLAYFEPARHLERPHRSHQRAARAPAR